MGLLDIFGDGESSSRSYVDPTQSPYLDYGYGEAKGIYQNQSPFIAEAQRLLAERGREGSQYNRAAGTQMMDTLGGAYMPGSEMFGDYMNAMYRQMRPSLDTQFSGAGRYGSGLHQIGAEERMADVGMRQYGAERDRQQSAMNFAPQLAGQDYKDIQALMGAGNVPWEQLQQYMNMIGPPTVLQESSQTMNPNLSNLFSFTYGIK